MSVKSLVTWCLSQTFLFSRAKPVQQQHQKHDRLPTTLHLHAVLALPYPSCLLGGYHSHRASSSLTKNIFLRGILQLINGRSPSGSSGDICVLIGQLVPAEAGEGCGSSSLGYSSGVVVGIIICLSPATVGHLRLAVH